MPTEDDWRRQGQEKYLNGVIFFGEKYTKYREGWDHDHCEFCNVKFMEIEAPGVLTQGYVSEDNYRWVCEQCFNDFRNEFSFKINNCV